MDRYSFQLDMDGDYALVVNKEDSVEVRTNTQLPDDVDRDLDYILKKEEPFVVSTKVNTSRSFPRFFIYDIAYKGDKNVSSMNWSDRHLILSDLYTDGSVLKYQAPIFVNNEQDTRKLMETCNNLDNEDLTGAIIKPYDHKYSSSVYRVDI